VTSAGIASNWWERPIPMAHRLAKRAVAFGNDPVDVARWFAEGVPRAGIFCRVCSLPMHFCVMRVLQTETRCWERPSTGMQARDFAEDNFYDDNEDPT
jgi:hypothetical protein